MILVATVPNTQTFQFSAARVVQARTPADPITHVVPSASEPTRATRNEMSRTTWPDAITKGSSANSSSPVFGLRGATTTRSSARADAGHVSAECPIILPSGGGVRCCDEFGHYGGSRADLVRSFFRFAHVTRRAWPRHRTPAVSGVFRAGEQTAEMVAKLPVAQATLANAASCREKRRALCYEGKEPLGCWNRFQVLLPASRSRDAARVSNCSRGSACLISHIDWPHRKVLHP